MVSLATGDGGYYSEEWRWRQAWGWGKLGNQARYIHLGHGLEMVGGLYAANGPGTYKGKRHLDHSVLRIMVQHGPQSHGHGHFQHMG